MEARSLGPARSPGRAIYEQELERSNRQQSNPVVSSESTLLSSIRSIFPSYNSSKTAILEFKSRVAALPRPYHTNFAAIDTFETQIDEELAWFGSKLVWSRGSTVYRTFTYYQEKQKVTNAIFARFTLEAEPKWRSGPGPQNGKAENEELSSEPAIAEVNTDKQSEGPQTFGPFHTSQHAKWGRPDKRNGSGNSAKGKQQTQQRCLVVLLEDWIHVYYPSGHDLVVALPFPIDDVWAIPSGGIMLQRTMNNREVERLRSAKSRELGPVKIAGGMDLDATMELVLEELEMDRMEGVLGGNGTEDARLYTLTHPSSELQTVCQSCHIPGGPRDIECRDNSVVRLDQVEPLEPEKELIWLSDTKDTKLAVFHDHKTDEIVFARWENCNDESVADAPKTDHNIKAVGGSAIKAHDVSTKRPDAPLRPGLGRVDSTSGSLLEKRSSVGGSRSLGRAHNRRVSFKPDVLNPAVEKANHDPLAALEGETAISTRIKAEGDLVRGLPHQRRVSQGMKEVERKNKVAFDDLDVGENTMLFGIDQPKARMQPDMVMMEIHRWPLPDST
jgi:anaphase-promoting complex subunit 1